MRLARDHSGGTPFPTPGGLAMPDDPLFLFQTYPAGLWPLAAFFTLLADLFRLDPGGSILAVIALVTGVQRPPAPPIVFGPTILPQLAFSCLAWVAGITAALFAVALLAVVVVVAVRVLLACRSD
jgi:hypothetical protein